MLIVAVDHDVMAGFVIAEDVARLVSHVGIAHCAGTLFTVPDDDRTELPSVYRAVFNLLFDIEGFGLEIERFQGAVPIDETDCAGVPALVCAEPLQDLAVVQDQPLIVAAVDRKNRVLADRHIQTVLGSCGEFALSVQRVHRVDVPDPDIRNVIGFGKIPVLLFIAQIFLVHRDRDPELVALVAVIRVNAGIIVREIDGDIALPRGAGGFGRRRGLFRGFGRRRWLFRRRERRDLRGFRRCDHDHVRFFNRRGVRFLRRGGRFGLRRGGRLAACGEQQYEDKSEKGSEQFHFSTSDPNPDHIFSIYIVVEQRIYCKANGKSSEKIDNSVQNVRSTVRNAEGGCCHSASLR